MSDSRRPTLHLHAPPPASGQTVDLYDLATGQLAIVLHLPLDAGRAAAILRAAARNGFGFHHELAEQATRRPGE